MIEPPHMTVPGEGHRNKIMTSIVRNAGGFPSMHHDDTIMHFLTLAIPVYIGDPDWED